MKPTIGNVSVVSMLFAALLISAVPGYSQPRQYRAASDVALLARDLSTQADRVWQNVRRDVDIQNPGALRGPRGMELYMGLSNFSNASRLYADMTGRYRSDLILRGGAQSLIDQAEAIDRLMDTTNALRSVRDEWDQARGIVANLSEMYNLPYSSRPRELPRYIPGRDADPREPNPSGAPYGARTPGYGSGARTPDYGSGTFTWRGRVDGSDYVKLRGNQVTIEHLQAQPVQEATSSLSSALPRAAVNLRVIKLRGRGRVQLVEQPSPANDYTAIVMIEDPDGGSDYYEFQLTW